MNIIKIFLHILIFFYCFVIKCDEYIKIFDDDIKGYFCNTWVNNISNKRDVILVKMEKEKNDDVVDDYNSKYKCKKDFKYNGEYYRLFIDVEKDHNLTYSILKKDKSVGDDLYKNITDDEKKIFYRLSRYDKNNNIEVPLETMKSLFHSKNYVLLKLKTHDNKEFYAFINDIFTYWDGKNNWGPLAYGSNFKELYIIYSNIRHIYFLTSTIDQTDYNFIDLKGLNFEDNNNVVLSGWFVNATSLTKFRNIPNFLSININSMLDGCKSLKDVDLGDNVIICANNCFKDCENLENIDLKNVKIKENANLNGMFSYCKSIKKIEGFNTFIKEKDNPNIENMLEGAYVDGELDISQWGTNIVPKEFIKNGKVNKLKLFNLKKILEYYIEFCKKEIKDCEEKINNKEKKLEDNRKELENLNKIEPKTEDDKEDIKYYEGEIKSIEDNVKKLKDKIKKYQDDINGNGEGLKILQGAIVDELYINEEFIPEDKKDLDRLVGKNCTVKMIYIVDKDGNCKKYQSFDDYKNNNEYKEPEYGENPINPEIPEDKGKEITKGNTYLICCGKCWPKCCCCCNKNNDNNKNKLLGKKRNRG